MTQTLQTAIALRAAGIATIPTKPDKRPIGDWKRWQTELPSEAQLQASFANGASIALIAGSVLCLDFDEKYRRGILEAFTARAMEHGLGGVLDSLILQRTPSGGFHLVCRCDFAAELGNVKLATTADRKVMIETRGQGGYFLIAPSPGYELIRGDWANLPEITEDERDELVELARSFDEAAPLEAAQHVTSSPALEVSPADDYNARGDVPELLSAHGWTRAGPIGTKYWTRPDKKRGISASWDVVPRRLYVFSSSTVFEPSRTYTPHAVFAFLECGGDFAEAVRQLRRRGFGSDRKPGQAQASDNYVRPLDGDPPAAAGMEPTAEDAKAQAKADRIRAMLAACEFDDRAEPPPLRPIFSVRVGDQLVVISTPGNITALIAQAKAGKTAFLSAMISSTMAEPGTDCLSIVAAPNPDGKAVLYFDTEQSPDDFWHVTKRSMRRAQAPARPEWFRSYCLTGKTVGDAKACVWQAVQEAEQEHGGVFAVFLDGAADCCLDVNSAEECNAFVSALHALAIRYDCPIVTVLHLNPISGKGGAEKARGHLGSQLERKAETNLRIDKAGDVSVAWSEKQRRAPIFRDGGPSFKWSEAAGMHVTAQAEAAVDPRAERKIDSLRELAEAVFGHLDKPAARWADVVNTISTVRKVTPSTAEDRFVQMRKARIVIKQPITGLWQIGPRDPVSTPS